MELQLKNLLMMNAWARKTCVDRTSMEQLLTCNDKKTLGRLLNEVRQCVRFDGTVDEMLAKALDRRNFLVHGFFEVHAVDFMSSTGREKMIDELLEIAGVLDAADGIAKCLTNLLTKVVGIPDQVIQGEFNRMLKEAANA